MGFATKGFGSPPFGSMPFGGGGFGLTPGGLYARHGGIYLKDKPDHEALGRVDPIVTVNAGAAGYEVYNPGGTLGWTLGGGSYDLAANYFHNQNARSRNYDGVLDWDKIWENDGAENALDWQASGIWVEVFLYGDAGVASPDYILQKFPGGTKGWGLSFTNNKIRSYIYDAAANNVRLDTAANYNDNKYHVIRYLMPSIATDTVRLWVDNAEVTGSYAASAVDPATSANTQECCIGCYRPANPLFLLKSRIPVINIYAGEPTATVRDAYYNRLKEFGIVD